MYVPPPPGDQMGYEIGKARQQDVEARLAHREELAEARDKQSPRADGLWAWLRARLSRRP